MMRLHVGRIVGAHGIKGELRIFPLVNDDAFYRRITYVHIDGFKDHLDIESLKKHQGMYLLKISEICTRTEAERLRGMTVMLDEEDMPKLDEGYYIYELIGLRAVNSDGEEIGVLTDVLQGPVNDVYVIQTLNREIMIPNVPQFVIERNIDEGLIRVELIEGM